MSNSSEMFTTQEIADLLSRSSGAEFEERILAETRRCLEEQPTEEAKQSIDKLIEILSSFKVNMESQNSNAKDISDKELELKLQENYDKGFNDGYTKANYDMINKIIDDISKVKSANNITGNL